MSTAGKSDNKPRKKDDEDEMIDESSIESFPASDPPSTNPGRPGRPKPDTDKSKSGDADSQG